MPFPTVHGVVKARILKWLAVPFSSGPNKIPYDYTVEVRYRFKGLDLIDRVPDELWTEVRDIVQETGIDKDHPQEKEMQKSKMAL